MIAPCGENGGGRGKRGREGKEGRAWEVAMITVRSGSVAAVTACICAAALAAAALSSATCVTGCGGGENGTGKVKVAADIMPLAYLCREVGGDMVEVEVLVPPGSSPHTFELTGGQMKFLSDADLLVTVGLGLTPWAEEVFGRVDNPRMEKLTVGDLLPVGELIPASEAIALEDGDHAHGEGGEQGPEAAADDHGQGEGDEDRESDGEKAGPGEEYPHDHEHAHGLYDPHVWLDPLLCEGVVLELAEALSRADPDHASYYRERAEESVERLRILDAEVEEILAGVASRRFLSFHSSLTYFARRYGLEQVGVIEELPGKEPSAGEVAELVDLVRELGVKAVFAERQFSPRAAQAIAESAGGGVVVATIDPLADPGDPEGGSYEGMLRELAGEVAEALR